MVKSYSSLRGRSAAAKSQDKDVWDKISALTVPFVTLVLGMLGAYATYYLQPG